MRVSLNPYQVKNYYKRLIDACKKPTDLDNVIDELFLDCETLDTLAEKQGLLEKGELPANRTYTFYTALAPSALLKIYGYAQDAVKRLTKENPKLTLFDFRQLQDVAIFLGFRLIQQWCIDAQAKLDGTGHKKRRLGKQRDEHTEEAYQALGDDASVEHLCRWINNRYEDKYRRMKPDNFRKSNSYKSRRKKKK